MSLPTSGMLPCGTRWEDLLDRVADREGPAAGSHAASCAYCQAALGELEVIWAPVRRWAAREVAVPLDFVRAVMLRVRRIASAPRHLVVGGARGATTVTSWVLGLLAAGAAEGAAGVIQVLGRGRGQGQGRGQPGRGRAARIRSGADGVEVTGTAGGDLAIGLAVAVSGGRDLLGVADEVRDRVIADIAGSTGLAVAEVDVTIAGLYERDR